MPSLYSFDSHLDLTSTHWSHGGWHKVGGEGLSGVAKDKTGLDLGLGLPDTEAHLSSIPHGVCPGRCLARNDSEPMRGG